MVIEELIDQVQMALTASYALPKELPDLEIRRIIQQAQKYFYRKYRYATMRNYWYIPADAFTIEENNVVDPKYTNSKTTTMTRYVDLPCNIQSILSTYLVNKSDLINIGLYAPNLNIGLGITGQPYLTSYVTSIAELGTYRSVLENFSTVVDKFNKIFVQQDITPNTNRLRLLGQIGNTQDMIIETADNIPLEDLYDDELFQRYVIGESMYFMGMQITRFNFQLPQGFQYNADNLISEGKEMKNAAIEEIKGQTTVDFFIMRK